MLYLHDDQAFLIYFGDIFRSIKKDYLGKIIKFLDVAN